VTLNPIHVQIVYGSSDIEAIAKHLIPSLSSATERPVIVWCLNFHEETAKFECSENVEIHFINREGKSATGFGANHNRLFRSRGTDEDFIIVNPDCVLLPESIDRLLERKLNSPSAAIVEGRQWPFEHPKEYDVRTLETPWASGAFAFISGEFFEECDGFDEIFYLYLEDVDLSWRAWLSGRDVIYEPEAVAVHFSNGPFYRSDVRSKEEYYGSRNFLVLMYKHFGTQGEEMAEKIVFDVFPEDSAKLIVSDFRTKYRELTQPPKELSFHPQMKVLGFNKFHEMQL